MELTKDELLKALQNGASPGDYASEFADGVLFSNTNGSVTFYLSDTSLSIGIALNAPGSDIIEGNNSAG